MGNMWAFHHVFLNCLLERNSSIKRSKLKNYLESSNSDIYYFPRKLYLGIYSSITVIPGELNDSFILYINFLMMLSASD